MPTNVSIEFEKARAKSEQASSLIAKLAALQEMKSTLPKHKGTEKMLADITKKIAKLKSEIEKQKMQQAKRVSRQQTGVKKEGIGQVAVIGMPNAGKSSLLKALTNVNVEIAPYGFTTKKPVVGMASFEEVRIQLVELPAIIEGSSEGKAQGTQVLGIARTADAFLIVLNSFNCMQEFQTLKKELEKANIRINESKPKIKIEKSEFKGISISGKEFLKMPASEFEEFLKGMGLRHCNVVLEEETTLDKVAKALDDKIVYKNALIVCLRNCRQEFEKLKKLRGMENAVMLESLGDEKVLKELKEKIFKILGKVRVFTKKPGKKADFSQPLVLKEGSTVENVAELLHKDFARNLRFVRVWGSARFPGQKVPKSYWLKDKDLIEIYS